MLCLDFRWWIFLDEWILADRLYTKTSVECSISVNLLKKKDNSNSPYKWSHFMSHGIPIHFDRNDRLEDNQRQDELLSGCPLGSNHALYFVFLFLCHFLLSQCNLITNEIFFFPIGSSYRYYGLDFFRLLSEDQEPDSIQMSWSYISHKIALSYYVY